MDLLKKIEKCLLGLQELQYLGGFEVPWPSCIRESLFVRVYHSFILQINTNKRGIFLQKFAFILQSKPMYNKSSV